MLDKLKRLLQGKPKQLTNEEIEAIHEQKEAGLVALLGPMHEMVGHAIIPFAVGGAVDMYYFPHGIAGTAFATMELIEPDGSGPRPSNIGTYELAAYTRKSILNESEKAAFESIERRFCGIFTTVGLYSRSARLNPLETMEIPVEDGEVNRCLISDFPNSEVKSLMIGKKRHGLLVLIEVFKTEMNFARANGVDALIQKLKDAGHYPYSDLDRLPVC